MTRVSFFTRQGDARDELQDSLLIGPLIVTRSMAAPMSIELDVPDAGLLAVFDGMGGHAAGRRASGLAAVELAELLSPVRTALRSRPALDWAIVETGRRIIDESELVPGRAGMGTTVAGIHFDGARVWGFNVGDSRAYSMQDRYLCQYSIDDDAGAGLTQCLGADLRAIEPHIAELPWDRSLAVLLCSDGLHRHTSIGGLEAALAGPDPIADLWALADGARDDVGVVLVDRRPVERPVTAGSFEGFVVQQLPPEVDIDVRSERRTKFRRRPRRTPASP